MNIQTAITTDQIREYAQIALSYRLYVREWVMRTIYSDWIECMDMIMPNDRLSIAWHDQTPIGAATFTVQGSEVMVYVKPKWRRQGVGTRLVESVIEHADNYNYGYGIPESYKFWPTITDKEATL